MEPTEKPKSNNKLDDLNFNLKNIIFDYFSYENILKQMIPACKSFKVAYFKRQEIQPILKNYKTIFKQITLSNAKIAEVKINFFSHFDDLEDQQETKKDEIIRCLLLKKYKNQKTLWLMKNPKEKNIENFLSLKKFSELEKKLIMKNKDLSFIDSKDLNIKYFSESLAKNEFLVNLDLSHNYDLFKNHVKRIKENVYSDSEDGCEDSYYNEDQYSLEESYEESDDSSHSKEKVEKSEKAVAEKDAPPKLNENLKLICNAIAQKKKLKVLKFNENFSFHQYDGDKDLILEIIKKIKSLEVLELRENELGSSQGDAINLSLVIKENFNLIKLDLSENIISKCVGNLKLLCDALVSNWTLSDLNLSVNDLGRQESDMLYMKLILEKNSSIKNLDLADNKIGTNANDVIFLFKGLAKNTSLKTLILNANRIGENEFSFFYIFKSLNRNKTLENLELSENEIIANKKNSIEFTDLFEYSPQINIKKLNLELNCINLNMFCKIFENNTSLQELDLSNNEFDKNPKDFMTFCHILGKNKTLRNLNLQGNRIGQCVNCMNFMTNALLQNTALKKINLKHNLFGECKDFSQSDYYYFRSILENNHVLQEFEFEEDNEFLDTNTNFAGSFLEGLLENKSLLKINLKNFKIGKSNECVLILKEIIEKHPTLNSMDLSLNCLADQADNFNEFCAAIQKSKKLEKLVLDQNNIGKNSNDLFLFCKAIEKNKSLKEIDFGRNLIFENYNNKKYLMEYLYKNNTIKKISFKVSKKLYDAKFIKELKLINRTKNIVYIKYN